jgi:hypothetical protein
VLFRLLICANLIIVLLDVVIVLVAVLVFGFPWSMPHSWSRPKAKAKDPELFDREYRKQPDALGAKQVAEDLGPNAILLLWESFNVRCHRRLVAEWLEEKLGIVVPELGHERFESIPFNEEPSKPR